MALELLETNIVLDVYDHDGERPSIKSIALDDNTRYVFARLTYQGNTYDIGSTASVKLVIIRPDKVGAQVAGEAKEIQIGQEDESIVSVYGAYAELDQPAIAVAGTLLGQFVITSGDQILRSQIFAVNNGEALDADEWSGEYDGYNLDELVEKVDAAVDKVDGMEADVTELKSGLTITQMQTALYNAMNLIAFRPVKSTQYQGNVTNNGITYEWHDDNTCSVSGTASSLSFNNIYSDNTHFPSWLKKGETYVFKGGTNVSLEVYFYKSGTYYDGLSVKNTEREYTIPADIDGLIMRLQVANGVTVSEIVSPICREKGMPSNAELYEITNDLFNKLYNTAFVTDSASGSIAHIADGADSIPMKSFKVNIVPVQSGSGNPSPNNVRPISAWNSIGVTIAGKSFIDFERLLKKWGANYTKTEDAFIVTSTGAGYRQPYVFAQKDVNISVSAVITDNEGASGWRLDFLNANNTLVATLNATTSSVANVMASKIRLNYGTGGNGGTYKDIQVELGSEVTEFEPYNGKTYDISLVSAGAVYGGTLDVISGELVIDRRLINLSTSGYTFSLMDAAVYPNNYVYKNYSIGNMLEKNNSGDITKIVCNYLPSIARNNVGVGVFQIHDGNANEVRLSFLKEDRFATWDNLQEWMRSLADPFVLCIPLDDSLKTTYNLTPTEVKSLLGINNIWSDAGDVEVEYRADTKLYIDKRLAEVTA